MNIMIMKKIKSKKLTRTKILKCGCSDKKNYLIHYKMSKFYVKHGMIVDKSMK